LLASEGEQFSRLGEVNVRENIASCLNLAIVKHVDAPPESKAHPEIDDCVFGGEENAKHERYFVTPSMGLGKMLVELVYELRSHLEGVDGTDAG